MLDPRYFETLSEQMTKAAADQLSVWPLCRANVRAMKDAAVREIAIGDFTAKVVNIPSRAISTKADTSADALRARPCFLCAANRPVEQRVMPFEGAKGKRYNIQLNPYPILPNHFVIPSVEHIPQSIWHRFVDMLRLAKRRPGYTILYNGPRCGASAPDHFHFQAVPSGLLPLECSVARGEHLEYVTGLRDAGLFRYHGFASGVFVLKATTSKSMNKLFYRLLDCVDTVPGDDEPRFNLICWRDGGEYKAVVVLRSVHRGANYYSGDPKHHLTMSPGCVDMCGCFVTIDRGDFDKMDGALLRELIDGVTISAEESERIIRRLTRSQQTLHIALGRCDRLDFEVVSDGAGMRCARMEGGRIEYGGALYDELYFGEKTLSTMLAETSFVLHGENGAVCYPGSLKITADGDALKVENIIGLEDCVHACLSTSAEVAHNSEPECVECLCKKLRRAFLCNGDFSSYRGLGPHLSPLFKAAVDATWGVI